jgi:hypothetical protein
VSFRIEKITVDGQERFVAISSDNISVNEFESELEAEIFIIERELGDL